ncbi:hypothetical protein BaRGS_00028044, partial [Batillaria attramentaria]
VTYLWLAVPLVDTKQRKEREGLNIEQTGRYETEEREELKVEQTGRYETEKGKRRNRESRKREEYEPRVLLV